MKYQILIISCLFYLIFPKIIFANNNLKGITMAPVINQIKITDNASASAINIMFYNNTDHKINLNFSFRDIIIKDLADQPIFLPTNTSDNLYSLINYVQITPEQVNINPHSQASTQVSFMDTNQMSIGGHYGALIAKLKQNENQNIINQSISSLIIVDKKGDLQLDLKLTNCSCENQTFVWKDLDNIELTFKNNSNIHLTPYGKVIVTDFLHRDIYRGIINTKSKIIFPHNRKRFIVPLKTKFWQLPISINKLEIIGQESLHKINYHKTYRYVYINKLFFITIMILIIGFFIIKFKNK